MSPVQAAADAPAVRAAEDRDHAWSRLQPHLPLPCRVVVAEAPHGGLAGRLRALGFAVTTVSRATLLIGAAPGLSVQEAADRAAVLICDDTQAVEPLLLFEAADRLLQRADARMLLLLASAPEDATGADARWLAMARRTGWQRVDTASAGQLLQLHRPAAPETRLASIGAAQNDAVRALFPERFGHAMSAPEWRWKYGQGRGCAVGLYRGDALVAHYGGLTRPVLIRGTAALACQIGDVMVAPDVNAGLARNNVLHQVAATFLESQIGFGRPHAIGFGFPNARHMRLAQRLRLYAPVDAVHALSWTALPAVRTGADSDAGVDADLQSQIVDAATLREDSANGRALAQLWTEMAAACADAVLGVRDVAWLRHRYGTRPHTPYRLLLCRSGATGQPFGLLVLRLLPRAVELVDLLGPPRRFAALVRRARRAAAALGRPQLEAWVSTSHSAWLDDPADPATVHAIDVTVPANVHTRGIDPEQLRGRWFLMGGDTDFR